MAYETGAFDSNLAASVGEDPALLLELRGAFIESAEKQLDLLRRSRCDANWHFSALRLKGLASSFGVTPLMALADEAIDSAPGEPVVLRRMSEFLNQLR